MTGKKRPGLRPITFLKEDVKEMEEEEEEEQQEAGRVVEVVTRGVLLYRREGRWVTGCFR